MDSNQQMRPRHSWALLICLLLLGAGVIWWSVRFVPFHQQSVPLNGGGSLTLVSVQGGQVHASPFDPVWRQLFARLPAVWAQKLHVTLSATVVQTPPRTNSFLTCWLAFPTNTGSVVGGGNRLGVWVGDDLGYTAGDDHGLGTWLSGFTRDGSAWEVHRFDICPRRSEWLRIRVADGPWGGKQLGEFRVRNPLFDRATPPFANQAVPQTVRSGDLDVALEQILVLTNKVSRRSDLRQSESSARLEFTLRQHGEPSTNWVSYHVATVADATGNLGDGNSWNHGWLEGRAFVEFFQYPLPAGEPWRVQVEFCQRAGFPTNEVWKVRGLKVARSEAGYEAYESNLHGAKVTIKSLALDSRRSFGQATTNSPVSVVLKLTASTSPDTNRWHLTIVRAVDDRGNEVTANSWSGGDLEREFSFLLAPPARAMDVEIVFAPSRILTFTAQPAVRAKP